jgi:folylpolyglutamate synthase/dihydropteroate synthase
MGPILPIASEIIFAAPDYARAASPEELSGHARMLGFRSTAAPSVKEAMQEAIRKTETLPEPGRRDLIVITGSFYTIGEAKMALGHRGVLASLRE